MKKLICFILAFGLILAGSVCAFADDPEETTTSSGDRLATQEEIDETNLLIREAAESIYSLQSEPTRSTYTVDDIYNLLLDYCYNQSSGSTNTFSRLTYNEIITIRQFCNTMNTSLNALVVTASGINSTLTNFYNSINGDYATTGISIYDELRTIITFISSVDPNDQILTLPEYLMVINSNLEDCALYLSSIVSSQSSIDSKLTNIYNYLSTLNTSIQSVLTATQAVKTSIDLVNTSLSSIYSEIQSFHNDFNNISWTEENTRFLGIKLEYDDTDYITSGSNYSNPYIFVEYNSSPINYGSVFRFTIPIRRTISYRKIEISDIEVFYIQTNGTYTTFYTRDYYYTFDNPNNLLNIYFTNLDIPRAQKFALKIFFANGDSFTYTNSSPGFAYISNSNLDFYTVSDWILSMKKIDIFSKFEDLYASDDLIEAKQNQQSYEDQAIEDFTGSGSASASVSDLGNLKSVSGSLKSGLSSGGSVNNALAIFNINSGFWSWFSQSNYDDINTVYGSNTRLRNSSNSDNTEDTEQILDFYSNNQRDLFNLLETGD